MQKIPNLLLPKNKIIDFKIGINKILLKQMIEYLFFNVTNFQLKLKIMKN